jgi:nucleoside-diphosphate-sugar epimerase
MKRIFITGGAGYVGTVLSKSLLDKNYLVTVYDLLIYGNNLPINYPNLKVIKGDIRDREKLKNSLADQDCVIHLACISNDPSFELNPSLGKSINLDSFRPLVEMSVELKVKRFIYASSSSVYGVKKEKEVTEDVSLTPLTDYSNYKAKCEKILSEYSSKNFETVTLRPATVCGYSPRQRFDLIVNILTNNAFNNRVIKIFNGDQLRPNIHINDMVRAYELLIQCNQKKINNNIFNIGSENYSVREIAEVVKKVIGNDVQISKEVNNDNRSYHISSERIKKDLNFDLKFNVKKAIIDLKKNFEKGIFINSMTNENYFNVKKMNLINLK